MKDQDRVREIRNAGKPGPRRITDTDRPVIKAAVLGYHEWRRARGLEPSAFWVEKVKAGLLAEGLKVRAG